MVSLAVVALFGAMVIGRIRVGAMELVGPAISSRVRSLPLTALLIYLAAVLTSALISDVAVLLAMSAMLFNAAKRLRAPPAAYVSPLAFAVVLGGRMVGTSADIVLLGEYLASTGERIDIFALFWDTLIFVGSFIAIGRAAASLGLLNILAPYLSSAPALFAIGLALSNSVGAVPAATLLGGLCCPQRRAVGRRGLHDAHRPPPSRIPSYIWRIDIRREPQGLPQGVSPLPGGLGRGDLSGHLLPGWPHAAGSLK